MICGIGTDIIELDRIRSAIDSKGARFINKVFTPSEQAYCSKYDDPIPHYAGRFAAKEAVIKALGVATPWLAIEIHLNEQGKPTAIVDEQEIMVSISHSRDYATAIALNDQ